VRHPGEVKIWISKRRLNFETHPEVVRHDILRAGLYKDLHEGWGDDGKPRFVQDDPLIEMAALIKSAERASKNDLRGNYIATSRPRAARSCSGQEFGMSESGKGALIDGGQLADTELVARIMGASVLPRPDFDRVRKAVEDGGRVSDIEKWSYERTRLELFYRAEASEELILSTGEVTSAGGASVPRGDPHAAREGPGRCDRAAAPGLELRGEAHLDLAPALVRLLRLTPLWQVHPNDGKSRARSRSTMAGWSVPEAERVAREGRVAGSSMPRRYSMPATSRHSPGS
jgi:hypothetical protein